MGAKALGNCVEYQIIDAKGDVVRDAIACSDEELKIVEGLVNLVNRRYGTSFKVVVKGRVAE